MVEVYPPINGLGQPFPEDAGVAVAGSTPFDKHRIGKYPSSLRDHIEGKTHNTRAGEGKEPFRYR